MFKRYQVTAYRATFWFVSIVLYWALIFLAWWNTRFRVFLGYEVFMEISARKKIPAIMANMDALTGRAWTAMTDSGPVPGMFLAIPLVMALIMFIAPFIVRRDYRRPVRGTFMLPLMALLCYLFTMLMNMVAAASMELALYYYTQTKPGQDFFMLLIHPLYLFYPPALRSVPGSAAQVLYIAFICSVLTMRRRRPFVADAENTAPVAETPPAHGETDENVAAAACAMEADRLCRIIESKVAQPSLINVIRNDIAEYIRIPSQIEKDVNTGIEYYRIVLMEAAKSLRRIVAKPPARPGTREAFEYVIDELERMEYCTTSDAQALRNWLAAKCPKTGEKEAQGK
jgi:hypothetical protein